MSLVPPKAPIVAEKYWHSTGTYNQAQGRIHQHQSYAELLPRYRDGRETPALQLYVHCLESKGPCESCLLSIPAHGRTETSH
jgi:hypothetical protein